MKPLRKILIACGLALGVQAQIADFTPQTPLIGALLHNDSAEAMRLLEQGADPNQGWFAGFPPLLLAVVRQDLDLVRKMISKGADLKVRDRSGSTALMWAAFNESGDAAVVEELLKLGADPHAANKAGETALTWALRRGETPVVAALRRTGVSGQASIRAAVERTIPLLQKSGSQFLRVSGCFSCHHQSLPQMAFGVARKRGFAVDEAAARQQVDATIALIKTIQEQALSDSIQQPVSSIIGARAALRASSVRWRTGSPTIPLTIGFKTGLCARI